MRAKDVAAKELGIRRRRIETTPLTSLLEPSPDVHTDLTHTGQKKVRVRRRNLKSRYPAMREGGDTSFSLP
jgi:hypothetical protein